MRQYFIGERYDWDAVWCRIETII